MPEPVRNPWLTAYFDRFRNGGIGWQAGRPLEVCFVVGYLGITGGNTAILEHATYLRDQGALVTLVPTKEDPSVRHDWHDAFRDIRVASIDEVADRVFDVAIATWWETVYELPRLRFRHAVYFVQSIESRFYANGEDYERASLAELTYRFGIPAITVARWAEMYLELEHDSRAFLVRNGIAKDRYSPTGEAIAAREPGRVRALIEGDVRLAMKGVHEAVEACREAGFAEIWLMTTSDISEYAGVDRVLSKVAPDQTGAVYRSADVLVKLSQVEGMYGPPLEMFHCGGTVVTWDVTGSEEYVVDGVNGLVREMSDFDGLRDALRRVVSDSDLLERLKQGAERTAAEWPDWKASSEEFAAYVFGIASGTPIDSEALALSILGAPAAIELSRAE